MIGTHNVTCRYVSSAVCGPKGRKAPFHHVEPLRQREPDMLHDIDMKHCRGHAQRRHSGCHGTTALLQVSPSLQREDEDSEGPGLPGADKKPPNFMSKRNDTHTHTHRDIHTIALLTHTCHCHWHPPTYRSWLVPWLVWPHTLPKLTDYQSIIY